MDELTELYKKIREINLTEGGVTMDHKKKRKDDM